MNHDKILMCCLKLCTYNCPFMEVSARLLAKKGFLFKTKERFCCLPSVFSEELAARKTNLINAHVQNNIHTARLLTQRPLNTPCLLHCIAHSCITRQYSLFCRLFVFLGVGGEFCRELCHRRITLHAYFIVTSVC